MKAVIMAGGKGTRLYPLTQDSPKPLIDLFGRPLIDHTIELLRRHGCDDVILTTGHQAGQLLPYVQSADYSPTRLYCAFEEHPLGTAGSVRNAAAMLNDTFVIMSGDTVTDADLSSAVEHHRASGAMLTIIVRQVDDVSQYGSVTIGRRGLVSGFVEKPPPDAGPVSRLANTGMYIMEPEVLSLIPEGRFFDFAKHLFPRMLAGEVALHACEIEDYWCDVGTLPAYWQAHQDVLAGAVRLPSLQDSPSSLVAAHSSAKIDPSVRMEGPVIVGPGVVLEAGVCLGPYTAVGEGAFVGSGTHIAQSVLNPRVSVGSESHVRRSIIGDGTSVPHNSRIVAAAVQDYVTVGLEGIDPPNAPVLVAAGYKDMAAHVA